MDMDMDMDMGFGSGSGLSLDLDMDLDLDLDSVMVLFGATAMVHDVLQQMAIDQIMPIVATEARALQQVRVPD